MTPKDVREAAHLLEQEAELELSLKRNDTYEIWQKYGIGINDRIKRVSLSPDEFRCCIDLLIQNINNRLAELGVTIED